MEEFSINILNISAVLLSAYLGGILIRKFGYPAILGELLIGIILGPGLLGVLEFTESIKVLAEVGIILLMVYIGMEIDFIDLKKASWPGLLAAFGGFFVPFFLGYYTIIAFGGTPTSGLFVAIAIGVTSLATKSRILIDLKLLNTRIAYVLMAGALISDTLALVIFSGITNFAESSSIDATALIMIGVKIIAFFAITISIGIFILPLLGKYLSQSKIKSSTAYFTLILIIAFGYCELAELAGMHSILGAFMAGLFLKENIFRKKISKKVQKAFYDVSIGFMAPIFFVSAGFFVDINVFRTDLGLLILITAMAIVGKIVGTALFYLPSKNGWREGITIGTGMNGRGAVEIIIAEIGLELEIIDKSIFSILVFMAIFTTLTVPVLLKLSTRWLRSRGELVYMDKKEGVLILGVNPISLIIARYFKKNQPITFVDNNKEMAELAKSHGFNCIKGNFLDDESLSDPVPEDISSFIGFTTNSEINLQCSQVAQKSYLIPNLYLTIAEKPDNDYLKLIKELKAKILYPKTSNLDQWFKKVAGNDASEVSFTVDNDIKCSDWLTIQNPNTPLLPLIIISSNKKIKPFSLDDSLKSEDTILAIQQHSMV